MLHAALEGQCKRARKSTENVAVLRNELEEITEKAGAVEKDLQSALISRKRAANRAKKNLSEKRQIRSKLNSSVGF